MRKVNDSWRAALADIETRARNDDERFLICAIAELYRRNTAQFRMNIAMMFAVAAFSFAEITRWGILLWG